MENELSALVEFIDAGGTFMEAERITGISDSTLAYWYVHGLPRSFNAYGKLLLMRSVLATRARMLKRTT